MSLKKDALRGISWTTLNSVVINVLRLIFLTVLARILGPESYGLLGMVLVVRNFVAVLRDAGFSSAIVVHQELEGPALSSVFWLNLFVNVLLYAVVFFVAPLLALWFTVPLLVALIRVSLLGFFIDSGSMVSFNLLRRELRFREIFFGNLWGQLVYGAVAITLAVMGYGVWSLVIGDLSMRVAATIYFWVVRPFRIHFHFKLQEIRHVVGYSAKVLGGNLLNYVKGNIDGFVIGRLLGASVLGYYSLASRVIVRPITELGSIVYDSLLPIFARLKGGQLKRLYPRLLQILGVFSFSVFWAAAVASPELVSVIYGSKWMPAVPFFMVRCGVAAVAMLAGTFTTVFYSQKRPELLNYATITVIPVAIVGYYLGAAHGVHVLVWATLGVTAVDACLSFVALTVLLSLVPRDFVEMFLRPTTYGAVIAICLIVLRLTVSFSPGFMFGLAIVVALLLLGLLMLADARFWRRLLKELREARAS